MNTLMQMKLNKIILVLLLSATHLLAQDIGTTEVKVVEGFKPSIPQAIRLDEKAIFTDTLKKDRTQEYTVIITDLKSDYKTRPLKAAKVKDDKISQLYGNKVAFGFGSAYTTKASVVHNSMRSKRLSYGVLLNHFSNKYYIDSYIEERNYIDSYIAKRSKNTMHLYAKKISSTHVFITNLEYERRTSLYSLLDDESFSNRFSYTKLSLSAISQELSADKLKHHTTFFVSDLNEFSENQIHLSTNLSKTINGFPFSLEIELNDYLNYNNSNERLESTDLKSLHFSPFTSFKKYGIDFYLGLELHYLSDDTPFEMFPQIKVTKELVKDVLLICGGLRHSEQMHTFKSLSNENPYIHSFGIGQAILSDNNLLQDLRLTDTDEMFIEMRNVFRKDEVFEGSVAYGSVENFAHFVGLDTLSFNRFLVDYIDVKQLHINAHYERKINNIMSVNVNTDFYKRDTLVYYKPNFTCELSVFINLRNKIKVKPNLSYLGERFYAIDSGLSPQFHANLGLYYNYSQNIGAYLELNNLTNSKHESWKDYREVGFNGLLGLNYSF